MDLHQERQYISRFLQYTKVQKTKRYKPWLPSPPSLIELSGNVVNNFPLPICWQWNIDDVVQWLWTTIELPQYKDCFVRNHINGRRLLNIDASVCPRIGIRDFEHIKKITQGIRKLFNVEREKYKRCISLPPRYPWTHYLLYRVPTGPTREETKATQLFNKMGIIQKERICQLDHWDTMNPQCPDFPLCLFGYGRNTSVIKKC